MSSPFSLKSNPFLPFFQCAHSPPGFLDHSKQLFLSRNESDKSIHQCVHWGWNYHLVLRWTKITSSLRLKGWRNFRNRWQWADFRFRFQGADTWRQPLEWDKHIFGLFWLDPDPHSTLEPCMKHGSLVEAGVPLPLHMETTKESVTYKVAACQIHRLRKERTSAYYISEVYIKIYIYIYVCSIHIYIY